MAECQQRLGHFNESLENYDRVLQVAGPSSRVWMGKGEVYQQLGLAEEAAKCYKRTLGLPD